MDKLIILNCDYDVHVNRTGKMCNCEDIYAQTDEYIISELEQDYTYDGTLRVFLTYSLDDELLPANPNSAFIAFIKTLNSENLAPGTWEQKHLNTLWYFRARYFSDEMGRFISRDPLGYVDGFSLYGGSFAERFKLDPSGYMTQSEEDCIYQMQNVQGMSYEEAKKYCCEKTDKPKKKCKPISVGYDQKGDIPWTLNNPEFPGKRAIFKLSAKFVNDPENGFYCECCEVRQYIKWDTFSTPPLKPHNGFVVPDDKAGVYYEDRNHVDKVRYGRRKGVHKDPKLDSNPLNCYKNDGCTYQGVDAPGSDEATINKLSGIWTFQLKVHDICPGNNEAEVQKSEEIRVVFPRTSHFMRNRK